jgi:hypothetical protein
MPSMVFRADELPRFAYSLVAFDVLETHVQEPHSRPSDIEHIFGHDRSHECELQKMLRRATDVGAKIEHVGRALGSRDRGNDGGTIDAG